MGDETRLRKFAPAAFVAVTEHVPAPSTVNVVPLIVHGWPPVTAYVTAPSPDPPVVDSDTVVLFGAGEYVTDVEDATAVSGCCTAFAIVNAPATYVME